MQPCCAGAIEQSGRGDQGRESELPGADFRCRGSRDEGAATLIAAGKDRADRIFRQLSAEWAGCGVTSGNGGRRYKTRRTNSGASAEQERTNRSHHDQTAEVQRRSRFGWSDRRPMQARFSAKAMQAMKAKMEAGQTAKGRSMRRRARLR